MRWLSPIGTRLNQPQGAFQVDWSNPLAPVNGAIILSGANNTVEIHTRNAVRVVSVANLGSGVSRVGRGYSASLTANITSIGFPYTATDAKFTCFHAGFLSSASTAHRVWEIANGARVGAVAFDTGSGRFTFSVYPASGGTTSAWGTATGLTGTNYMSLGISHDGVRTNAPIMTVNGSTTTVTNLIAGTGTVATLTTSDTFILAQRDTPKDRGWPGSIDILYLDNTQRTADELRQLHDNPWQLFLSDRRIWFPTQFGGAVTVAVTGVQSTSALGTVVVAIPADVAVTGVQTTSALGTVTVVNDVTVQVTGVQSTSALGSVVVEIPATVAVTGVQTTSAIGDVTVDIGGTLVNVTGVQTTSAIGSVTVVIPASVAVTGIQTTGYVGTVQWGTPTTVEVTGIACSGYIGSVEVGWSPLRPVTPGTWNPLNPSGSGIWTPINDAQSPNWH